VQGIVITGNRTVSSMTFPDPDPGPGEVVVAIRASGLCGTDIHRFRAHPEPGAPVIAGHEPAGIVIEVGPGVPESVGRIGMRVMIHHYEGCTVCRDCRSGWTQMCSSGAMKLHGRDVHGAFAPFMKVPAYTLLPLDDQLSFAVGAAIGCGTGTAWGALERMGLKGTDTLVVVGQGPVGASATLLAAAQGVRVIALDVQSGRLDVARAFGAWQALDASDPDLISHILELTEGRGADMVLETSGSQQAADAAPDYARPWATVCFVGVGARVNFDVYAQLRKQLTVLTSWTMSQAGQLDCANFVIERGLDLDALFTDHWHLSEAQQAFERFDRQLGGKAVFLFD